jgi:hypothetical protein
MTSIQGVHDLISQYLLASIKLVPWAWVGTEVALSATLTLLISEFPHVTFSPIGSSQC